jgi:membrane-bound ClpP family serine protease
MGENGVSGDPGRREQIFAAVMIILTVGLFLAALLLVLFGFFFEGDHSNLLTIAVVLAAIGLGSAIFLDEIVGIFDTFSRLPHLRKGRLDSLKGRVGEMRTEDMVFVNGARWRVDCDQPLKPGDRVEVLEVHGLTLKVRRLPQSS